ncbi:thiamine phosphate synthase [Thalassobacillus devorans]|uniref:thiamine phosphate synthase n=1 Tax=Thalassobacillus devorans TaxID=279813 RepID=UPI00048B384C|nr:thiamine phosphate synthase [Thalassobacillus devorans]
MKMASRLRKYLVMGSVNCDRDPAAVLLEAIEGGITAFQYREKGRGALQGKEKFELGMRLRSICKEHEVLFIVNDDIDLVESLEADGVHVGQDDVSPGDLRKIFPEIVIGLSVSNWTEVEKSPMEHVNYLGAGPLFPTSTKADAKRPVGPLWIKELRGEFPSMPIVGIGGINCKNAHAIISAGADGVAVISAITQAENIPRSVKQL